MALSVALEERKKQIYAAMPESELTDMGKISNHPGYRAIWRTVLKTQIKQLVEQLSFYGGEEAILLSASLNEGTLSHIGSESGEVFLSTYDQVKKLFLGFCLKRHKKPKRHKDTATERCTQDSDKTVTVIDTPSDKTITVIDTPHTQTSVEQEKNQTAKPSKDKTTEVHRQDSGETSKDGTVTFEDKKNVTVFDNAHTQTSAKNEKDQTEKTDGTEYIKEEHSYIAEKESSTSSIEDVDDTSESDIDIDEEMLDDSDDEMLDDSDEEMLDDSDEEMLDDKNETVKLDGAAEGPNLKDIQKNSSTCVNAIEESDKEDSDNADFKFLEMTCDEISTEFADGEFSEINLDKLGETLVIVKDEPDSDVSVGEPQEGVPGTSKDSTHDTSEKAAVGVYSNGKIRWTNPDLEDKYSRSSKESVKPKCQSETHDKKFYDTSDSEEKNSREPKPRPGTFYPNQQKTLAEKYHAIIEAEQGKKRKVDIAREYKVPQNTLSTWLKSKDRIKISYLKDEFKKKKSVHQAKMIMLDWMQDSKILKKRNAASDSEENEPKEPKPRCLKPKEPKPKRLKTWTPQTLSTKYRAIMEVEKGKKRKCDIAKEFNIPQNTLSTWLKFQDKIKNSYLNRATVKKE